MYLEQQLIERELKERKEQEAKAFANVQDQSQKWQQAKILRAYISDLETKAIEGESLTDELKSWLIWAKQRAEEYDTLTKEEGILVDFQYLNGLHKKFNFLFLRYTFVECLHPFYQFGYFFSIPYNISLSC